MTGRLDLTCHTKDVLPDMHQRDSYRSRVYEAERAAGIVTMSPEFTTVAECQAYVNKVQAKMAKEWPAMYLVKVGAGRGARNAFSRTNAYEIVLPKWARSRGVIVHELAHQYCDYLNGVHVASHGREFLQIYLRLVWVMLGAEAEKRLKAELKARKVPYTKKRQLSAAQRAALAERARNMRVDKAA